MEGGSTHLIKTSHNDPNALKHDINQYKYFTLHKNKFSQIFPEPIVEKNRGLCITFLQSKRVSAESICASTHFLMYVASMLYCGSDGYYFGLADQQFFLGG